MFSSFSEFGYNQKTFVFLSLLYRCFRKKKNLFLDLSVFVVV